MLINIDFIQIFDFLCTHEAGGFVFGIAFHALDGEMDLVLSEAFVDSVDGLHEPFLACAVFGLLRSKEIQLHAAVGLQLGQEHAGLFILVARPVESLEERADRLHDPSGVVGRRGHLERIVRMVLREVGAMPVRSEKDGHGAAQRALLTQPSRSRRRIVTQLAQQHGLAVGHMRKSAAIHDTLLPLVTRQRDSRFAA